jgi:hypothetical protein
MVDTGRRGRTAGQLWTPAWTVDTVEQDRLDMVGGHLLDMVGRHLGGPDGRVSEGHGRVRSWVPNRA